MRLRFDNILPEIYRQICDYLDSEDLLNLSLASKRCGILAKPILSRTIHLVVPSAEPLAANIERLLKALSASSTFNQVHNLKVITNQLKPIEIPLDDYGGHALNTWKYCRMDGRALQPLLEEKDVEMLYSLLTQLPALRNLFWTLNERLPLNILKCLNQTLPHCRLHLQNFRLFSLCTRRGTRIEIDAYDMELITSPCLYSIALMFDYVEGDYMNFTAQAVLEIVSDSARGLREVSILHGTHPGDPRFGPKTRWVRGKITPPGASLGNLHHLELYETRLTGVLEQWSTITDFSVLRSLKLHGWLEASDLRWLTENCQFISLRVLDIKPALLVNDDPSTTELADATEGFIRSLPPLQSVKLTAHYIPRTVSVVLQHCGSSLRHLFLWLPYHQLGPTAIARSGPSHFANPDMLREMRKYCPNLEELGLPMLRTQGDDQEVGIYRSFGQMPGLRKLHLSIYGSQYLLWKRGSETINRVHDVVNSNDEEGMKDVHGALIDFAIDQKLVKSISEVIAAAKSPTATPFQSLELQVIGLEHLAGPHCTSSKLISLLQYLGQSWICSRKRSDRPFECVTQELDAFTVRRRDWINQWIDVDEAAKTLFARALSTVWPGILDGDWRTRWHSLPLAE